jgi:hypothetical protein
MNVQPYSHHDDAYSNESTANAKRKLYNPMFTDSPASDIRPHQSIMVSHNRSFQNNHLYSENL